MTTTDMIESMSSIPWVEKYRPKNLDQISAQHHTVNMLKKTLNSSNLPHMLFYGPPGTGKTSTILALAREMYGTKLYHSRVLELNASDDRGINVVREKIKNFARTVAENNPSVSSFFSNKKDNKDAQSSSSMDVDLKYVPTFKLIILDEADNMSYDAQAALRRTMESTSKSTRFCIICNYITRIIEPITSRCSKFRFGPLPALDCKNRLSEIATAEGLEWESNETLDILLKYSQGDLRKAITILQSAAQIQSAAIAKASGKQPYRKVIHSETVLVSAGVVPDSTIQTFWQSCQLNVRSNKNNLEQVIQIIEDCIAEGNSADQIISQLHDLVILNEILTLEQKYKVIQLLSEVDHRLVEGADETLQLLNTSLSISCIMAGQDIVVKV